MRMMNTSSRLSFLASFLCFFIPNNMKKGKVIQEKHPNILREYILHYIIFIISMEENQQRERPNLVE